MLRPPVYELYHPLQMYVMESARGAIANSKGMDEEGGRVCDSCGTGSEWTVSIHLEISVCLV